MKYLLDTNVCIELIRARSPLIIARLRECRAGSVGLSAITLAELQHGAMKSSDPRRNGQLLTQFCALFVVLPFDDLAAVAYGRIRSELERSGTMIGPMDLLIAAHALAANAIVVTNNEREFRRVAALSIENWGKGK